MKVEQIMKIEQIRRNKKISVGFVLILCLYFLYQWSRIDDIICMIFLSLATIVFGYFAGYMMDAHYDDKIDKFYREEVSEFLKAGE